MKYAPIEIRFPQTSDLADLDPPQQRHDHLWILNVNSEQINQNQMNEVLNAGQVGTNYYFLQFSFNYEDTDVRGCATKPQK